MTMTDRDPQTLARGLTKAQREAVILRGARSIRTARALLDKRLYGLFASRTGERWYSLQEASDLGLQVRALLEKERVDGA